MNELRLAFAFLTCLPVGVPSGGAGEHAVATRFFPIVGAVLAIFVLSSLVFGAWFFDRTVACVLALIAWSLLTGGLHLDGLADCVDGLAVQGTPARRLQVMHDPRVGGIGAVGVMLWLFLKFALISRCVDQGTVAQAVFAALVFARTPLAFELSEGEPANPGSGLFSWLHTEMRRVDWVTAGLVGAALLLPVAAPAGLILSRLVVGVVLGSVTTLAWHLLWYRKIGGLNGDVLGGAVEIREVCMLIAMGIHLPW